MHPACGGDTNRFSTTSKFEGLLYLIDVHLDFIWDYANNKRHIDEVVFDYSKRRSDNFSLDSLETATNAGLLVRVIGSRDVLNIFRIQSS